MEPSSLSFDGEIPRDYDRHLGPVLLEPYADDLSARLPSHPLNDVLELACGTGILTRKLLDRLPPSTRIVATDLSPSMLSVASEKLESSDRLVFQQADAASLPFVDASFDAIFCQFGLMFVPDKRAAFSEARRVLRPGGSLRFNVWNSLAENDPGRIADEFIHDVFPNDPPQFMRVPYSYHDRSMIRADLEKNGFVDISITSVLKPVQGTSARSLAGGFITGSPLKNVLKERGVNPLDYIDALTARLALAHGESLNGARLSALVVSAHI